MKEASATDIGSLHPKLLRGSACMTIISLALLEERGIPRDASRIHRSRNSTSVLSMYRGRRTTKGAACVRDPVSSKQGYGPNLDCTLPVAVTLPI